MIRVILTILLASGPWFNFTLIYNQNKNIESAYDAYFEKEYDSVIEHLKILTDSLEFEDEGLQLNIAHSTFQKNGFSGPNGTNTRNNADSVYLRIVESTFYEYAKMWDSQEQLSSKGYHQAGMVTFKSRVVNNAIAEEKQLISSSMDYFKNALRKDPYNEKARYNYEILKKYNEFPEQVMERVKNLVKLRRYQLAYTYLAPYAEKDSRFIQYQDYAKRLGDIVNIETQNEDTE